MNTHTFDPGWSGLSRKCNHLVPDEEGYANTCNKPADDPIHWHNPVDNPSS